MLARVAQVEGFNFEETLTGFKWLGNRAQELVAEGKVVLLAFEEAIGYMIGGIDGPTVFDKDGICAAAVFATYARRLYANGQTIASYLEGMYMRYVAEFFTTDMDTL